MVYSVNWNRYLPPAPNSATCCCFFHFSWFWWLLSLVSVFCHCLLLPYFICCCTALLSWLFPHRIHHPCPATSLKIKSNHLKLPKPQAPSQPLWLASRCRNKIISSCVELLDFGSLHPKNDINWCLANTGRVRQIFLTPRIWKPRCQLYLTPNFLGWP